MAPSVRNPIAAFVLAIVIALVLSPVAAFGTSYLPYVEFQLFFLGLGLFGIGVLAARYAFLGSLGFLGTYLGAFVGLYLGISLFWWQPFLGVFPLALTMAAAAGLGGFMAGRLGMVRLDRYERFAPTVRRCHNCGNRVGAKAHKCWSCKATLTY